MEVLSWCTGQRGLFPTIIINKEWRRITSRGNTNRLEKEVDAANGWSNPSRGKSEGKHCERMMKKNIASRHFGLYAQLTPKGVV